MTEASATRRPARPRTLQAGIDHGARRRCPSCRCRRGGRWWWRCRRRPCASSSSLWNSRPGRNSSGRYFASAGMETMLRVTRTDVGCHVPVLVGGQIVGPDLGLRRRVGRGDAHPAAAGRADVGDAGREGRERIERLAELGQRERLDVILQVGRLAARIGLHEGAELGGRHGHRPAPRERVLRREAGALHQALEALVHGLARPRPCRRSGSAGGPAGSRRRRRARARTSMPSGCSTAPGPMPDSCRICGLPMAPAARITSRVAVKRARLRRAGARRGPSRACRPAPAARPAHASRPSRLRRWLHGAQEALGGVPAHAGLLVDVEVAAALVVAAVEVVDLGDAGLAPPHRGTRRGSPSGCAHARCATRRRGACRPSKASGSSAHWSWCFLK